MVYRLYLETVQQEDVIGWAFIFYNHQDFPVYKRCGKSVGVSEKQVILERSAIALAYFEKSMRRRYYDEHFSTRIDEDYVTLFTHCPEIADVAKQCKSDDAASIGFIEKEKALWEALLPFFAQKTMSFEKAADEKFINTAKELASAQF